MADAYLAHRTQISYGEETTPGTKASTCAAQFGMIESMEFPDPTKDWKKYWALGAGRDYNVKAEGKNTMESSFDVVLQTGTPLFYAFGQETCTADVSGTGQTTLATAMTAGSTTATLASASGITADLYIQIGESGSREIRKISDVSGSVIILDKAVRFSHVDSAGVSLQTGSVYTHTLSVGNTLKSFTIEAAQLASTNFVRWFTGCYIDTYDISCEEEGELMATFGIKGMKIESSGTAATTIAMSTTVPYMFDEGVLTCFGAAIGRVKTFKISGNNKMKPLTYINSTYGRYAAEIVPGRREISLTFTAVPDVKTWWDKIKTTPTATTCTVVFTRTTSTDTITFTLTDVNIESAPHKFNEENEQDVEFTLTAQSLSATVVDAIPYYWAV